MSNAFKKLAAAALLAAAGTATAGEPTYKKVVSYELVTCTEVVEVPYTKVVTKYDECGKPYPATVTAYRRVEVTSTKRVPVVKYVKVCDALSK